MSKRPLPRELLALVAGRFKVLADPARLELLQALRGRERTVGELVTATGYAQANVSKHLQQLHAAGFVTRRKTGLFVRYRLAGQDVFRLCDIMCGRLEADQQQRRKLLAG